MESTPAVNSENEESDRDMVQNPVVVVFYMEDPLEQCCQDLEPGCLEKLFDKTPNRTGFWTHDWVLVDIWKDEKSQQIASTAESQ